MNIIDKILFEVFELKPNYDTSDTLKTTNNSKYNAEFKDLNNNTVNLIIKKYDDIYWIDFYLNGHHDKQTEQNKDNLKNYMFIINKVIGLTKEYIDKYKLSPIWISCKGDPEGNKKYNIYKKIIQKNENYFKDYEIDYNDYSQLIRFYKNN